jgi:hypothetical protein
MLRHLPMIHQDVHRGGDEAEIVSLVRSAELVDAVCEQGSNRANDLLRLDRS